MKQCHKISLTATSQKSGTKGCYFHLPFTKIKMISKTNIFIVTISIVAVFSSVVFADADSDASASIVDDLLTGQNRAAKPEPFLDRIAALFGGGSKPSNKGNRPAPVYQRPPRPSGGTPYKPPVIPIRPRPPQSQPIPNRYTPQQGAPSSHQPTYVNPGIQASYGRPPRQPAAPQSSADAWQIGSPANMASIKDLQVQCEKDLMRVRIKFDRPFYGMVFSKGHYRNANCVHVPSGLGQTEATFDIALQSCGMSAIGTGQNGFTQQTPQGSYIENTIIIQYDPLLQEVWDQARRLRCTWYDFYEKAVTFRPYQVDMLDPVTANFLGDNLRCWMQIQVGKGPQASEVSGIVKIGQTMTMVIGVKDDENKFDMMVRNCVAHDGSRAPIQLVDEKGCVSRPKIMSPFRKVKNFDTTANVLSYAYFQAFKFPDSMNVHFQCVVQVCRGTCPEPQCGGGVPRAPALPGRPSPVPNQDGYGSPAAPAISSYGAPLGNVISGRGDSAINPRLPGGGSTLYSASGDATRASALEQNPFVATSASPDDSFTAPQVPNRITLTEPGYGDFNKRLGHTFGPAALGGRPRSLESPEDANGKVIDAMNILDEDRLTRNAVDAGDGDDSEVKRHRRRRTVSTHMTSSAFDANGNRILKVSRRDTGGTDVADVQTAEKVIQVIAPNDVQFHLPTLADEDIDVLDSEIRRHGIPEASYRGPEEVIINTNNVPAESLCVDTMAFVGATVTFIMILVIALITIIFLWMRIRSMTANGSSKKNKQLLH